MVMDVMVEKMMMEMMMEMIPGLDPNFVVGLAPSNGMDIQLGA